MIGFLLPPKLPNTAAALRDAHKGSPESRWVAAVALGQENGSHNEAAISALLMLMNDPHEEIRAQALEGLIEQRRHGAAIEEATTVRALEDTSPAVRCVAVDAVLIFLGERAADHLLPMLDDPEPSVRAAAAAAAADLQLATAIPMLQRMLADSVAFVALQGAVSLAELGNRDGVPILIDALSMNRRDAIEAARALGVLGTAAAAEPLSRVAEKRFGDTALRAIAAVSLHRCAGERRAAKLILKLLASRNTDTQLTVLSALAALPIADMAYHVGKLLKHKDPLLVSSAIETLGALATVDRAEALTALTAVQRDLSGTLADELAECIATIQGS